MNKQYDFYLSKIEDDILKNYIKDRIIKQIEWYDRKSIIKQKRYKALIVTSTILNAIIPAIVLLSEQSIFIKLILTCFSSAAGLINTIIALFDYKKLWIQYRTNCEQLKSILYRFFLQIEEFNNTEQNKLIYRNTFVSLCESYITKEFKRQ